LRNYAEKASTYFFYEFVYLFMCCCFFQMHCTIFSASSGFTALNGRLAEMYGTQLMNAKRVLNAKISKSQPNPQNLTLAERILLNRRRVNKLMFIICQKEYLFFCWQFKWRSFEVFKMLGSSSICFNTKLVMIALKTNVLCIFEVNLLTSNEVSFNYYFFSSFSKYLELFVKNIQDIYVLYMQY